MAAKMYSINKGINRPIEFRGLKGQYIGYFAACAVGALLLFGLLYGCGMSLYVCAPLALGLGGWVSSRVFKMGRKYGQHGMMKLGARKRMPKALLPRSRKVFIHLFRP